MGSENRNMAEIKKKWSNVKLEIKKRVVAHRNYMAASLGWFCRSFDTLKFNKSYYVVASNRSGNFIW